MSQHVKEDQEQMMRGTWLGANWIGITPQFLKRAGQSEIPCPAGKAFGGGTAINSCESPVSKSGFILS